MDVSVNVVGLKEIQKQLGDMKDKAPAVLYNVIKRVASNVRKNTSIATRKKYQIKGKDIKETISSKKGTKDNPQCVISSKGNPIPIYKFRVTPKDVIKLKGVKLKDRPKYKGKVKKKTQLKVIYSSFVQKMKSGHIGLFRRKILSKEMRSITKKDIHRKISEVYGPSAPQLLGNKDTMAFIQKEADKTYEKRIEHEINRVLNGFK